MGRRGNIVGSETLEITISTPSKRLLEQIAKRGIYGRNAAEVAARFIDAALERFVTTPKLALPGSSKRGK